MWSIVRRKQNKKGEEGFTLIELIVVIAILGFLLALAIPRYTTSRMEAAKKSTQANLHNLANAVELYMTEYPTTTAPSYDDSIFSPYIPKAPVPPITNGGSRYLYKPGTSGDYIIYDPNDYGDGTYFYIMEGGVLATGQESGGTEIDY